MVLLLFDSPDSGTTDVAETPDAEPDNAEDEDLLADVVEG